MSHLAAHTGQTKNAGRAAVNDRNHGGCGEPLLPMLADGACRVLLRAIAITITAIITRARRSSFIEKQAREITRFDTAQRVLEFRFGGFASFDHHDDLSHAGGEDSGLTRGEEGWRVEDNDAVVVAFR